VRKGADMSATRLLFLALWIGLAPTLVWSAQNEAAVKSFNEASELLKKNDFEGAVKGFTEAIKLDKSFAQAYYNRGLAYHNLRDFHKAIDDYTQTLKLDANLVQAHNNRGLAY